MKECFYDEFSCIISRKGQGVLLKKQAVSKGQSIGGSRGDSIVENKKQQDAKLIEEEARRQEEARKAKNLPDNNQDAWWNK